MIQLCKPARSLASSCRMLAHYLETAGLLKNMGEVQQALFIEMLSQDLQPDWQALLGLTARDGYSWYSYQVGRDGKDV